MKKIRIFTVDAFTDQLFGGNPAGVVPDAQGLTQEEMQLIAKEINLSETAFLIPSDEEGSDYRIRYFTPTDEVDFCGHATVAASWIMGTRFDWAQNSEQLTLQTNVGIVPITWEKDEYGELTSVVMTQVEPKTKPCHDSVEEIFSLIGISQDQYDDRYPIKLYTTGNWDLLIPVKTKEAIDEAQPNMEALNKHNKKYGIVSTHLFTFDTKKEDVRLYTRNFSPAVGLPEDPVTGSANGALAGYLVNEGIISGDEQSFVIEQGNSLGRLGKLHIKTKQENGHIRIQVGGQAVVALEGTLTL